MKHLLIIVALFIGNSFAEDEFPIELTCETSEGIVYFSIEEVPEKTWMMMHPSSPLDEVNNPFLIKGKKIFAKKRNKRFEIQQDKIFLTIAHRLSEFYIHINRFSGDIKFGNFAGGKCFKGFKEYEKRKF